jgi:hypothetical protein
VQRLIATKSHDLMLGYISRLRDAASAEIKISEKWTQEPKSSDDDN